jgi:serine/threonine protein kinase
MVHRDIKPANLWMESRPTAIGESSQYRVKILDFGLARPVNEGTLLTLKGALLGTPAYMAPEQVSGEELDHRCDLFSLGCVLYRLATGEVPFRGKDLATTLVAVTRHAPRPPRELNPDLPPALADLILCLLAKRREDRPLSARAVAEALHALEGGAVSTMNFPAVTVPPPAPPRSNTWAWWVAAGVALLVVLGLASYLIVSTLSRAATQ